MKKKQPVFNENDAVLAKLPYREFGEVLRNLRLKMGISQVEMGKHLNLHPSYLSRLEHGERRPSLRVLRTLSELTEYGLENLLTLCGHTEEEGIGEESTYERVARLRREVAQLRRRVGQIAQAQMRKNTTRGRGLRLKAVPVFDAVPAGILLPAVGETSEAAAELTLPESELKEHPHAFALAVSGNSMVDAGILEGDIVVVSRDAKAKSGDIAVVALRKDDISLKVVYFQDGKVTLKAANRDYRPVTLAYPREVDILGKVIFVWRKLN